MVVMVRLKEAGLKRVLNGRAGMTFVVDSFTETLDERGKVAHVRDYRGKDAALGREFQIWSIGPDGYEMVENPRRELILNALEETVLETPDLLGSGIPGGVLYAALSAHGCSLEVFQDLMGELVRTGRLRKAGHQYFPPKGRP